MLARGYCVQGLHRFYHNDDHWGIHITPISTFSGMFVSEIQNACLRLFCTRFTWFTEILSQR